MKNILLFVLSICVITLMSGQSFASPRLDDVGDTNHHMMLHKFNRGVLNIVTSPAELPNQIHKEWTKSENNSAKIVSVFGGTVKGVAYAVGRIGSGLWDIVTFNLACPDDYAPIMKPEYICDHMNKKASEITPKK